MRDYYNDIPIGRDKAISKDALTSLWGISERGVRKIVQDLRSDDNGDNFIIVSFSQGAGYFRSDDPEIIRAFVTETEGKAASTLAPLRKAKRILRQSSDTSGKQLVIKCKLEEYRLMSDFKQSQLVREVQKKHPGFDRMTLSKAENGHIILTPAVLSTVCELLMCTPDQIYPSLLSDFQAVVEGC